MTATLDGPRQRQAGQVDVGELLHQVLVDWRRRQKLLDQLLWQVPWEQRERLTDKQLWERAQPPELYRRILVDMIALNKMPAHRFPYSALAHLLGITKPAVQAMMNGAPAELVKHTPAASDEQVPNARRRLRRNYQRWEGMQRERRELRRRLQRNIRQLKEAEVGLAGISQHLGEPRERVRRILRDR